MYTQDLLYSNKYDTKNLYNTGNTTIELINSNKKQEYESISDKQKKLIENKINEKIPKNIYKVFNYNDLLNSNAYGDSNPNSYNNENQKIDNKLNNLDTLFDEINNLDEKKYQKRNKTLISINSEDRNLEKSILPNNFDITLNKTYKNIEKIVLKDIYFPNSIPFLDNHNNRFTWEYPKVDDINDIFIPDPSSNNSYSNEIDLECLLPDVESKLIYSTKLNIKYSTIKDFEKSFSQNISNNFHHIKNQHDLNCITETNNERDYKEFTKISSPIPGIDIENHQILFDIDINPINHVVKLVNRIEKLPIYSYQIVRQDSSDNDIFYNYISTTKAKLKKDKIYILIKESDFNDISMNSHSTYNIFPLVITNIQDIGNITNNLINYTPFYDERIYSSTPENISTYKYFDTISFSDICGNTNSFSRLELTLSSGNINGLYFNLNGFVIKTKVSQTIISSKWLSSYISNTENKVIVEDFFHQEEIKNLPLIGRACPIKLVKSIHNDNTDIIESVLDVLGWPNENKSENIQNASLKYNYYYIHSNIDSFQKNIFTNLVINDTNIHTIFNYLSHKKN